MKEVGVRNLVWGHMMIGLEGRVRSRGWRRGQRHMTLTFRGRVGVRCRKEVGPETGIEVGVARECEGDRC